MKLYFEDSNGKRELIAEHKTRKECLRMIDDICTDKYGEPLDMRTWVTPTLEKYYDTNHDEYFVETIW